MLSLTTEQRDELLTIYRKNPEPELRFRSHVILLLSEKNRCQFYFRKKNRCQFALSKTSIFGRDSVGPTLVGQGSAPKIQCPTKVGPTGG